MQNEIGTDTEELASKPGLLLDLSLSMVAKRVLLASGLLAMLGGMSREKVRSLIGDLEKLRRRNVDGLSASEQFRHARDLLGATAKLEQSVMTLVLGRYRQGFGLLGCVSPASVDEAAEESAELELSGGVA